MFYLGNILLSIQTLTTLLKKVYLHTGAQIMFYGNEKVLSRFTDNEVGIWHAKRKGRYFSHTVQN